MLKAYIISYYLTNDRLESSPSAIIELSTVGFDKELSHMSSILSFNDSFTMTQYSSEEDCENFANFFFTNSQVSTFDRILIIFRPFVVRNSLSDVLLNVFRMNNFKVLAERTKMLNENEDHYTL